MVPDYLWDPLGHILCFTERFLVFPEHILPQFLSFAWIIPITCNVHQPALNLARWPRAREHLSNTSQSSGSWSRHSLVSSVSTDHSLSSDRPDGMWFCYPGLFHRDMASQHALTSIRRHFWSPLSSAFRSQPLWGNRGRITFSSVLITERQIIIFC